MKTSHHTFICILICLVPVLLTGQALQVQNQLNGISSPNTHLKNPVSRMTDPPLLRLSSSGAMGQEIIDIELIPLSLQSTGPIISLDQGDPMMFWDGGIAFMPNYQGAPFRIENIGSSGQDGIRLRTGVPPTLDSFFDVFYNASAGTETHRAGDPDFDLLRVTTYDKATPKLWDRISTTNPGVASFFDVFYDLQLGKETRLFGDPDFDLLRVTTYDKATPKLLDRISSNTPGVESFFDVFYDLSLATTGVGFGFDPDDLCLTHKFENDPPRLEKKIQSSNPLYADSFFDITYDLSLATETRRFSDELTGLSLRHTYDKATPKLSQKIASGNPLFADSFFDITYDLHFGDGTGAGKIAFSDLSFSTIFFPDTPRLKQVIASANPMHADHFFDITYDLNYGGGGGAGKASFSDLSFSTIFLPDTPRLQQIIASSNPMHADHFFDITYDLNYGSGGGAGKASFQDLHCSTTYFPGAPEFGTIIWSSRPEYADSFFDITYNLDLGEIRTEHKQNVMTLAASEPSTICWQLSSMMPSTPSFFDICYQMEEGTSAMSFADLEWKKTFDPLTSRLLLNLSKNGAPNTFDHFDLELDLEALTETHLFGDASESLKLIHTFDKNMPALKTRILSTDPLYVDSFFDIFYELDYDGTGRGAVRTEFQTLREYKLYGPGVPHFGNAYHSTDPTMADRFFDITYELDLGRHRTVFDDLQWYETFDPDFPALVRRLESTSPDFAGRYIEERMEIQTEMIPLRLTSCGFPGVGPMEVRCEFDGLSRSVREITIDGENGISLMLERSLSPSNPRILINGGGLSINGGPLSSDTGPLLLIDDVQMNGMMVINGGLQVNGSKMFRIDHPLDPENKYLFHSCVESPDMMNVYNGNIITDEKGFATVVLPDYFEALNKDFRYQLTCIGQFAQAIIDQKIAANQFVIRTDKPNVEVSWQVTGVRHDPAAINSGYAVEVAKDVTME